MAPQYLASSRVLRLVVEPRATVSRSGNHREIDTLRISDHFGKFARAHAENLVGCRLAILLASAIRSEESEPR